jgi:hypothetical protein
MAKTDHWLAHSVTHSAAAAAAEESRYRSEREMLHYGFMAPLAAANSPRQRPRRRSSSVSADSDITFIGRRRKWQINLVRSSSIKRELPQKMNLLCNFYAKKPSLMIQLDVVFFTVGRRFKSGNVKS